MVGRGVLAGALALSALSLTSSAQAGATDVVVDGSRVDVSQTRSTGHNDFLTDGVRVWTEGSTSTDKAAGYFDVHKPLADIGEPGMDWVGSGANSSRPGEQLVVDFDGDGSLDGILVGEPVYPDGSALYGENWWLAGSGKQFVKDGAPSHAGGFGSDNNGTLDQWRAAFPSAKVFQAGWSLGSGVKGDGTIFGMTLGSSNYVFTKSGVTETKVLHSADVDQSETRATGHNDFRSTSGVHVWTEGATSTDKAAGYFAVDKPLADAVTPGFDVRTISGGTPGSQLVMDFDNDGSADGILVGERVYGSDYWLTNGSKAAFKTAAPQHGGGFGSDNHGQLSEWRAAFPNARILKAGWSLGSGIQGSDIVNSVTLGTTTYTFTGRNVAPTAGDVGGQGVGTEPVTVTLLGKDANDDALTYSAGATADGSTSVVGNQITFTAHAGFDGVATFAYTADDGRGGSSTGTVTITIAKIGLNSVEGGPLAQGVTNRTLTLHGNNFRPDSTVSFSKAGVKPVAGSTVVVDANTIKVKVNVGTTIHTGPTDVTVSSDAGRSTCAGCLEITPRLRIDAVSPSVLGTGTVQKTLQITGSAFQDGAKVVIAGVVVNSTTYVSSTRIDVVVSLATGRTLGAADVRVTNADGNVLHCATCLTRVAGPTLTGMSPAQVRRGTSAQVTLTGTGFADGLTVTGPARVTFTNVVVTGPNEATATVTVGATASIGANRPIFVSNNQAAGWGSGRGDVLDVLPAG